MFRDLSVLIFWQIFFRIFATVIEILCFICIYHLNSIDFCMNITFSIRWKLVETHHLFFCVLVNVLSDNVSFRIFCNLSTFFIQKYSSFVLIFEVFIFDFSFWTSVLSETLINILIYCRFFLFFDRQSRVKWFSLSQL